MEAKAYDAIVVGGGIAGLQASIQLGRSLHKVVVIDKGTGRSTLCRSYHNVLGYPNGISGEELRYIGRGQAESTGVEFQLDEAVEARSLKDGGFEVKTKLGSAYRAKVMLLATGIVDRLPDVPGLVPCLGRSVYICPDCDGYEVKGRSTIVMGSGSSGANMAKALLHFTDRLTFVNHSWEGATAETIPVQLEQELREQGIETVSGTIAEVLERGDGVFHSVRLVDGRMLEGDRGFTAFGGNTINTELFKQLGAERMESKHAIADPRTKMTSVPGLFAAGDVGVHSEQLTIAMGEGQLAAIWMHKRLLQLSRNAKDKPQPAGRS